MTYKNPVISGFNPDPSVCRIGNVFYLATSSFEYFPGVPIYKSYDLVNWKHIGYALKRDSQLPLQKVSSSGGIWAPTLRYHNGRFYLITTNIFGGGHFYVYTDDIEKGEWSEPVWIKGGGHDPEIFFDDDGSTYFVRFSWINGIALYKLELESGKLLSEPNYIWQGYDDRYCEAPHIYKINGYYYLIVAEGGTGRGHMVVCARSRNINGPYEGCPHNPVLSHRAQVLEKIQSTGHGDLVQAVDGSWWIVFLATRHYGGGNVLGRETFLAPVTWDDEGWPIVNGGKNIKGETDAPLLPLKPFEQPTVRDHFEGDILGLQWNYRRNSVPCSIRFDIKPSNITLKGCADALSDAAPQTFIGCRQKSYDAVVTAKMEFAPLNDDEEAGITVLLNEEHHYEVGLIRENGITYAFIRRRIGDLVAFVHKQQYNSDVIYLRITADPGKYGLGYGSNEKDMMVLASGSSRYLAAENVGGFTGVYFGMYATGNGKMSESYAHYDWFDHEILPMSEKDDWVPSE